MVLCDDQLMKTHCENCGRELLTKYKLDRLELCPECGYKIEAAKAERQYRETKREEIANPPKQNPKSHRLANS